VSEETSDRCPSNCIGRPRRPSDIRGARHLDHFGGHLFLVVELKRVPDGWAKAWVTLASVSGFEGLIRKLPFDLDRLLEVQSEERFQAESGGGQPVFRPDELRLSGCLDFRAEQIELGRPCRPRRGS